MPLDFVVSHYRVSEAIGHGGMGEVYLGIDETLRRKVALKSILPDHRLNPAAKARFLREARTLSQLDHPNICRVHDYIETDERDWIVLEYVDGRTLADALAAGGKGLNRLAIAQQLAAVLAVTHAAGIVHRDLKPGNVMITTDGQVKVLDFGLSATVEGAVIAADRQAPDADTLAGIGLEETRLPPGAGTPVAASFASEAGTIKGTAAYMSPEQARGEIVTSASDMYSFGLVLQELFTGERPYQRDLSIHELLERRARGECVEPTGLASALTMLIARLKALAPAQRPTAVEATERLEWIANAPKRLRRNLIAAGVALAAVLGAAKYTIDLARERNAAIAARDEADQRRGQAEGLIGFMVGDLRDKLTTVGRLEILDDVGKQALTYFASVPADRLTDEELYRRSQALHQLGQIRQARADLAGALTAYQESLAQAQAVVDRRPDNAEWQLGLGTSHFYVGDVKMRSGDLTGALSHFEAYKAIAEALVANDPKNSKFRLEQSYGHSNVAAIYQRQGNLDGAREQLERAAAIQTDLSRERPDDSALQARQANLHNRLGIVKDQIGDLSGAAESFARELELYRPILLKDPRNAPIRRRLEVAHIFRGHEMRSLGQSAAASDHFHAAVREADALVALDATNANWQRDLGISEGALAKLEVQLDRPASAVAHARRAINVLSPLAQRNPAALGPQTDLAKAFATLADALHEQHNDKDAAAAAQTAVGLLTPFIDKEHANANFVADLVVAQSSKSVLNPANSEPLAHAIGLLDPLTRDSNDRNLLEALVRGQLILGRSNDAQAPYQKLMRMGYREPSLMALFERTAGGATR